MGRIRKVIPQVLEQSEGIDRFGKHRINDVSPPLLLRRLIDRPIALGKLASIRLAKVISDDSFRHRTTKLLAGLLISSRDRRIGPEQSADGVKQHPANAMTGITRHAPR